MDAELKVLIKNIKGVWDKPMNIKSLLEEFSLKETVIRDLSREGLENGRELYRDESGFILFAYAEGQGKYRAPHDHGDGWVIYTVVSGEVEMGSFLRIGEGVVTLKDKKSLVVGEGHLYEVGDIHDTRCLSSDSVILRFTSCDLKVEEQEGRMLRFIL